MAVEKGLVNGYIFNTYRSLWHFNFQNFLASGLTLTADDANDFYIYRLYGWSPDERNEIIRKYGHDIHWNSHPYPLAIETLEQLTQEHHVTFITARPEKFRKVTPDWVKRYKFRYHNITFTENKLQACNDLKKTSQSMVRLIMPRNSPPGINPSFSMTSLTIDTLSIT